MGMASQSALDMILKQTTQIGNVRGQRDELRRQLDCMTLNWKNQRGRAENLEELLEDEKRKTNRVLLRAERAERVIAELKRAAR